MSSSSPRTDCPVVLFSHDQPIEIRKHIFTIGRAPDSDYCLENKLVSGKHCELEQGENGTVFLMDKSTNGTIINGVKKLNKGQRFALNDGDIVYLVKKKSHSRDDISFTFYGPKPEPVIVEPTMRYSPDLDDYEEEIEADTPPLQLDKPFDERNENGEQQVDQTAVIDSTLPLYESDDDDEKEPEAKLPRIARVADEMMAEQRRNHSKTKSQADIKLTSQGTVRYSNEVSVESPSADVKPKEKENSSAMEETLSCSICCEIIHNCVSLSPCNHKFCGGCYSEWMDRSSHCPVCRNKVEHICKDHQFNAVIETYLKEHPGKKRSEEELKELDKKNKIVADNMKRPKRRRDEEREEEEEEEDSFSDTDYSDDNDDDEDGGHVLIPGGFGRYSFFPMLASRFMHRRPGFVPHAGRFLCRQCPGQNRGRQRSVAGAAVVSTTTTPPYVCQPNQNHFICQCCFSPTPDRRHDAAAGDLPKTQCSMCHKFFCHLYWGCQKAGCFGCLNKFEDMNFGDKCLSVIINSNQFESGILSDHLKAKNKTWRNLLTECLAKLASNEYKCEGTVLTADTVLCYPCALRRFQELAYQYRNDIKKEELPAAVTSRPDCWWGKNCTTQKSRPNHAIRLNHICEQSRFPSGSSTASGGKS